MDNFEFLLDSSIHMNYILKFDFVEFTDGLHVGRVKNHLERAIIVLEQDTAACSIVSNNYNCDLKIYKKCLKDFEKVYNLDTFEEDYPEWYI